MIHHVKFSLLIVLIASSVISAQKLNSLIINGNKDFEDSDYLKWSELRIDQPLFNGIVDSVKTRIARNILLQGYYFFDFKKTDIVIFGDSAFFNILIDVDEGNPTIIKNIFFENADSVINEDIIKQFDYLKGQTFNKSEIESNIEQLLIGFENSGYPFAKILISSVNLYKDSLNDENYADISLKVITGNLNKIDKVDIRGNTSTKDYVIIRELRIDPGESYVQNRIEEFPNRLNRLRFFEPVPVPQFYINSKNEGVLVVEVKEKNTNNFDGIIGYIPP
ncbi:MAG TPA: POTRA domain-containing protein, partial [Ignavibacteriaceae bacterium]